MNETNYRYLTQLQFGIPGYLRHLKRFVETVSTKSPFFYQVLDAELELGVRFTNLALLAKQI